MTFEALAVPWWRLSARPGGATLTEQIFGRRLFAEQQQRPVMFERGSLELAAPEVPLFVDHDADRRVGSVVGARDSRSGWRVRAVVEDPDAVELVRSGRAQLSIGVISSTLFPDLAEVVERSEVEFETIRWGLVHEVSLTRTAGFGAATTVTRWEVAA